MPWKQNLQNSGFNVLNQVPSKWAVANASGIQEMDFGETWNDSNEIKYTVISSQPAYWQVNMYDTYESDKWATSPATDELLGTQTEWDDAEGAGKSKLTYEVITSINTDVILLTGEFASAEMPLITRRSSQGEVTAAKSPRVLSPGESYTVRTYLADSSAGALNAAGSDYPEGIREIYLQLPSGFPEAIRTLSENITQTASTSYEKVLAIDDYLTRFPYSKSVDKLPEGADAVSDFLFTQKKGFCLHFASAMTVMLRSVGIPARLAVGYLPGDPGKESGEYLLRDKHYHAWAQVYFPGSGWIDFEATPSGQGSQVYVDTPLISGSEIQQSSNWNIWYYPPGDAAVAPGGSSVSEPEIKRPVSGALPFSDELGRATLIILCALAVFGAAFGLSRIIRPLNAKRIWHVDRNNLASSVYDSLCRLAAMNNLAPEAQQTPLEFSSQIAEIIPEQSGELEYLVKVYLDSCFGPAKGKPELYQEAEILKRRIPVYNAILQRKGKLHKFFWTS